MDVNDLAKKLDRIKILKRRKNELENQKAYKGATTDPAIIMEIDDYNKLIDQLEEEVNGYLSVSQNSLGKNISDYTDYTVYCVYCANKAPMIIVSRRTFREDFEEKGQSFYFESQWETLECLSCHGINFIKHDRNDFDEDVHLISHVYPKRMNILAELSEADSVFINYTNILRLKSINPMVCSSFIIELIKDLCMIISESEGIISDLLEVIITNNPEYTTFVKLSRTIIEVIQLKGSAITDGDIHNLIEACDTLLTIVYDLPYADKKITGLLKRTQVRRGK